MDNSILRYNLLSSFEQKEVRDFIDFLFSRKQGPSETKQSDYKTRILGVSTWSEEDIKLLAANQII